MKLPYGQLYKINSSLIGFIENLVQVNGAIDLPVMASIEHHQSTVKLTFMVVQAPLAYNAILGWPELNAFLAIVSIYHLMMKFLTPNGVGEV